MLGGGETFTAGVLRSLGHKDVPPKRILRPSVDLIPLLYLVCDGSFLFTTVSLLFGPIDSLSLGLTFPNTARVTFSHYVLSLSVILL